MKQSYRLTLHKKFILLTSFAIIVFMIMIGFFITRRESNIMYTDIEKQGLILAKTLAIPVINDLIYERLGLVEEGGLIDNYIMEIYKRRDIDLIYITVLDEKGRVLSHNDFREYGKIYNDPLTTKSLKSSETLVQKFTNPATGVRALDFATPLSIGKKRWGTLKFAISLQKVNEEIHSTIVRVIILTLLALMVGLIIIIVIGRRFIGPVTSLASTMQVAGRDSLDVHVDVKGKDELAFLGRSFNEMIGRIKQANEELKRTHEKLIQSEKLASVGILASGVAHEINNPLGGLFNAVKMLEKNGDKSDFRKRYLELLHEGLNRIETTVGRLLWMSRKGDRRPDNVEVRNVLEEIYDFVAYRMQKNHIKFEQNIDAETTLFIDPHDLQQILINLIINAIQSMNKGEGILTVNGYSEDSKTIIEVSDTGDGIDSEDIGKIFDPFYTTKKPGKGTGLGLWLTYEIVKNYNGDISVKSEKGQGSIFRVEFKGT